MQFKNDAENKRNLNRSGCFDQLNSGKNNRYPCDRDEENENIVYVTNTINITQTANANGGDGGDGGDAEGGDATGGSATGGSAAAASGVIAIAANVSEPDIEIPELDGVDELSEQKKTEELSTLQADGGTAATGGAAAAGNATSGAATAGTGGSGGDGGTASNSVELTINNIIIINNEGSYPPAAFTINNNGSNLDIKVDENGNTFVNGEKMDEKSLKDGTKVLIFRSTQNQKPE